MLAVFSSIASWYLLLELGVEVILLWDLAGDFYSIF
jgi:hypothetical protein